MKKNNLPYLGKNNLQDLINNDPNHRATTANEQKWMSITEEVEFLPLLNKNNNKKRTKQTRSLEEEEYDEEASTTTGAHSYNDPFSVQPFVEGMSNYDEYQQAWRLLGFMIDCNVGVSDDDDDYSGGSGDQTTTEEGCARYVIWAAVSL